MFGTTSDGDGTQSIFKRIVRTSFFLLIGVMVITTIFSLTLTLHAAQASFNLLDANKRGVTKIGDAKGNVIPTYDPSSSKDVFEIDYTLVGESSLEVWTKEFPEGLNAEEINTRATNPRRNRTSICFCFSGTNGNAPVYASHLWIKQ